MPDIIARSDEEAERFSANTVVVGRTLVMPAFSNDQLGSFARDLAALTGKDRLSRVLRWTSGLDTRPTARNLCRDA